MTSPQRNKQSKYFESLKIRNSFSDSTTSNKNTNQIYPLDDSSLSATTSNSNNLLSPYNRPFPSLPDDDDDVDDEPTAPLSFDTTQLQSQSSTFNSPYHANQQQYDLSPLKTPTVSPPSIPTHHSSFIQNRFSSISSSSSTPKSYNPSPSKRFSKSRLNNTENVNYSNLNLSLNSTLNSNLSPPNLRSPSNNSISINSPTRPFIDRNSYSHSKKPSLNSLSSVATTEFSDYFDDLSLLDNNETQSSFFKQQMMSPIASQDDRNLFDSPTSTSNLNLKRFSSQQQYNLPTHNNNSSSSTLDSSSLPLSMKIILNSRAEHNVHPTTGFTNVSYMEFWNLTSEEGKIYKEWDKSEFEIQSLIFEIFTNLKKIRFNLHRLIFIYGLEFKDTGFIAENVYDKTFEVLQEFYYFLDKLVVKKLKPLFDDHFLVDDTQVLKTLIKWFEQLKNQYRHISGAVVYLSKLSSNEDVKKLILGISKKDLENISNRSAVAPLELFNSYFVKLFTSIELLFDRLKSVYKDCNSLKNYEFTDILQTTIKEINNISDSTSELEKKISFNEKLTYKTEIDFSHMEMVDMFDANRKSKEPLKLEMKTNLNWTEALLAPFDNYLLILQIKSNSLSLSLSNNKKDDYILSKPPIAIQYLEFDSYVDGNYKIIIIKDIGNKINYQFRRNNDITIAILDRFLKDLKLLKLDFWSNLQSKNKIDLKIFNSESFIAKSENFEPFKLTPLPEEYDLIKQELTKCFKLSSTTITNNNEPILTNVLSCDYFTYKKDDISDRLCMIGTTFGIFIGKLNDASSFQKVHQIKNVKKITILNNDAVFCVGNESLYHLSIDKLYETYKYDLQPCDINIFQENKRNITDFTIGYQNAINMGNNGSPYLFAWKDKNVYYTELLKENNFKFDWHSFKTHSSILKLQTVYANNFAVGHIIDNYAVWNLSKLSDIRSIGLNQLDIKEILRNEIPIAIFAFPNQKQNISEVLVIFSKFCTRMKNVKGKYVQSTEEIIWFGFQCESATFDCDQKVLVAVSKQAVEIRQLYEDNSKKSELIGCLVGSSFSLINEFPGKAILKVQEIEGGDEFKRQIIFKIRRLKRRSSRRK